MERLIELSERRKRIIAHDRERVVNQLKDEFRFIVQTDVDLGWNKAIDKAIAIVKGGDTDDS